jgi:hypothetical protein
MSVESVPLLALAVALLLTAHVARAVRWAYLFPRRKQDISRFPLLVGLGMGYAVNALIPLRVGEVLRGMVASRLTRVRFPEMMATIVAERVADLFLLALVIGAAASWSSQPGFAALALFAVAATAAVALAALVRASSRLRRLLWDAAGIFNDRVRVGIADLAWSTSEMLVGGTLLRWRFTIATIGMWGLYGAAYLAFGRAIGTPPIDVAAAMLLRPLQSLTVALPAVGAGDGLAAFYVFVLIPVMLILLLEPLARLKAVAGLSNPLFRMGGPGPHEARSERFSAASGYHSFLRSMFSGRDRLVGGFGMAAVEDCVVHQFLVGGSDALTALVEADRRLIIRKFATGTAAVHKLRVQSDWLRRHAGPGLPLVEVIADRGGADAYRYDMPLVPQATDFYDAIHSSTARQNDGRLRRLLGCIDGLHGATAGDVAPAELVDRYLDEKVTRNAALIAAFARGALAGPGYSINGIAYDLDEWRCLADPAWLQAQLRHRQMASVHGDLTIENVIVAPGHPHGLYLIDPNPENIFDSPLIDWAKLMQSLHLGYEAMNRAVSCSVRDGEIRLASARSEAYAALHATLESEVKARFCEDRLREVYFHELVNYLRLTTYKIRQSSHRGLAFFACTSLLLRRYREKYA